MADPTVIQCSSSCTVTVVHELAIPALNLSVEEAQQIALPILVVWATAWAIRQVIRLIDSPVEEKESV